MAGPGPEEVARVVPDEVLVPFLFAALWVDGTAVIVAVAVNGCNKIGGGILPAIAALVVFTLIAWVL